MREELTVPWDENSDAFVFSSYTSLITYDMILEQLGEEDEAQPDTSVNCNVCRTNEAPSRFNRKFEFDYEENEDEETQVCGR